MPGICLWVWDINAHSDMRAETESRIKTSVRDVPSRVKTSSTQAETPATLNSPLRISTLARVSRNKRLLAIKNTDRGQLFTRPLHSEAVVTDRHNWITPTGATIPYKKGCMPVLEYYNLIIILRLPSFDSSAKTGKTKELELWPSFCLACERSACTQTITTPFKASLLFRMLLETRSHNRNFGPT